MAPVTAEARSNSSNTISRWADSPTIAAVMAINNSIVIPAIAIVTTAGADAISVDAADNASRSSSNREDNASSSSADQLRR
jgi:hypothetical protein